MKTCIRCGYKFEGRRCNACAIAYSTKYQKAHPDKARVHSAKYYAANTVKCNAAGRLHYAANTDKYKLLCAVWKINNRDATRVHCQNYQAKKRLNGGELSKDLADKLFKLQRGKCPCCKLPLGDDYHLDHILPVSAGGSNTDNNIQLLRKQCNLQKWKKTQSEFMQLKGFLI